MKVLHLLIFILTACNCLAQKNLHVKLWPGAVPSETEAKHSPVDYTGNTSGDNVHRITNITDPELVMYTPVKNANGAAVIISPGGGNKYLAVNLEGEEVAQWFAANGYTAFVLEYRVPLKTAGAFQDIQRAIRLVRSNAPAWHVKADLVGVMGFSAGGNLSARATTGFNNRSYPPEDKTDSLSCRPDFSLLIYPGSLTTADKALIPEVHPTAETPPVFVFVAADDQYNVPFALGQSLRELKLPFEFHVYPHGGHGYGLRKGNPAAEAWPPLAAKWLSDYVLGKKNQ